MQEQIYGKVRAFAEKNRIFKKCSLVAAGVSGGGDSMAMLDILKRLSGQYGFALWAVHVNHGIRGEEADRDQRLVEDICKGMHIPCSVYSYDVPTLASQWKAGLEETGRRVRREAFQRELKKARGIFEGRGLTALAHNRNDLAETMLHHLCRGTGIRGLAPMEAQKDGVIRPVLCLERREIDEYLKEREIPYVLDSTNLEDEYTRNRIRHYLIPQLEQLVNERAVSHMAETAELLGQAETFLAGQGRLLAEKYRREDGSYLFKDDFWKQEEILRKYAVREAVESLSGQRKDLSRIHISQILALEEHRTGALTDLPFGLRAERTYQGILLKKKKIPGRDIQEAGEYILPVNGTLVCPYGTFETKIFSWSDQKICEKKYTKWLDYDRIKHDVAIRTRKTGDYLAVNSEGHCKKLTRCMIDDKLPRQLRDEIPLAAAGNEILWMVGGRINERYKITSETKNVLEIKYQGGKYNE